MIHFHLHSAPSPFTKRFSSLLAFIFVVIFSIHLLSSQAAFIPISKEPHDHWAQLLRADRYSLVESPSWLTSADNDDDVTLSTINRQQNTTNDFSISIRSGDDKKDPPSGGGGGGVVTTTQTSNSKKVFKGRGNKSRFECHLYNEPGNLQMSRVISRTLAVIESYWASTQTVLMLVEFKDLGKPEILARGGGTYFVKMDDKFNTVLPVAAAEVIRQKDLNGNEKGRRKYDVLVTLNSKTPWYDGTDARPPAERYDLVTVLLHEIYHNVLFAGAVSVSKIGGSTSEDLRQSAELYRGYRTRFDSFLATKQGCPVLGYLQQTQLASSLGKKPEELLADSVCNDQLYWSVNGKEVARLHSPRLFVKKSSIYHLHTDGSSPSERLMFPTIKVGDAIHTVGPVILQMQKYSLTPTYAGAGGSQCSYRNPLAGAVVPITTPGTRIHHGPSAPAAGLIVVDDGVRRIANLPIWAFALLIVFAILLALLLLALCLGLCLKKFRKKKKPVKSAPSTFYSRTSKSKSDIGTSTSRSKTTYIPGHGGKTSSSRKTSRSGTSAPTSRHTSTHKSTSRHTSTRPSTSSRRTATDHKTSKTYSSRHTEPAVSTERTASRKGETCPSSGKSRYICCCKSCRTCKSSSVTPPPPVASVHTFDPDSVPATSSHKSRSHRHRHKHGCEKSLKKTCKTKPKVCKKKMVCDCNVCTPSSSSSSKSSRKCRKKMKCTCRVCQSSTSSKCTSTKHSRGKSSSCKISSCKTSSDKTSSCKTLTCKKSCSCKSSSKSSSKCVSRSSSKCSSKGSSSRALPSTKPPTTKPPSTKPVARPAATPACVPCQTCYIPTVPGTACYQCRNVVEINVGWKC